MRPRGDATDLEQRRRQAVDRVLSGTPLAQVARDGGFTLRSLRRWLVAFHDKGADGLAARPVPGRPRKLSLARENQLMRMLRRGPRANGLPSDRWEDWQIAKLIAREFEISYHPDHIRTLLERIAGTSIETLNRRGWVSGDI